MTLDLLRLAPFNLDDQAMAWVKETLAALTPRQRIGQLFVHSSMGNDPSELARLFALEPAGVTRFFGPDKDFEIGFIAQLQSGLAIPPLVSADLEGSRMSLSFGTEVPNPLALAAIDDLTATRDIARIMAAEAKALGINWSFTPVLDINAAFRSPIVATRGFGSDVARIERHALTQIAEFQAHGLAATVKHWPGEGHDDRDQHLVTTINPLTVPEWEAGHGRLYRAAIEAGVLSVMSAHIAFPAFVESLMPGAGVEAYRPASASAILTQTLLRERLGFNGLIVSDATPMAGFGSFGPRDQMLPEVIMAGCDIILFSHDPETDFALIEKAVQDGRITPARHEEALIRILGLKAALGLHKAAPRVAEVAKVIGQDKDRALAQSITARAPSLIKDVQGLLPLSPTRHKRVLIVSGGIVSPIHPAPMQFDLPDLLRSEGFEVTMYQPGMHPSAVEFDLMLYLLGEETLLTRGRIFLDWARLTGHFTTAMDRHWHDVPTAMISFGYPYMLYDAPRMPCAINAYSTMSSMQRAVLECLMGRAPFNQTHPVDPFCDLPDARF